MAVQRNREQIEALGISLAEMEWDCGYKGDNALDVAIHMRRGDLYQSQSEDDVDRYFSMDYYKDLLTRILHAWEVRDRPISVNLIKAIRYYFLSLLYWLALCVGEPGSSRKVSQHSLPCTSNTNQLDLVA